MTITRINPQTWTAPIEVRASSLQRGVTPSSNAWPTIIQLGDKNGDVIAYLTTPFRSDGKEGVQLETKRTVNGSNVYHGVQLYIDSSGTRTVTLSDPAAWRTGMGANNAGNLTTGTLPDERFSSGSTNASKDSTYISGGNFKITKKGKSVMVNAEGIAFKAFSGRKTVATVPAGYRPADVAYGIFNTGNGASNQGYFIVNTSGSIQVDGTGSAVTKYGTATYVIP